MTHLIDKDVLVAEIRKRLLPVVRDKHYDEWEEGLDSERKAILGIIDTLEVKEVDLEEKAKRFEESLNRAREIHRNEEEKRRDMEWLFPELKEPNDERVRKAIHIYLDWLDGRKDYQPKGEYTIRDMIAWLEMQGQTFTKKDVDDAWLKGMCDAKHELEKQGKQKQTDKVKPMFHEGDIIRPKNGSHGPYQIIQVDTPDKKYRCKDGYVIHFSQEDAFELVVEQKPIERKDFISIPFGAFDSELIEESITIPDGCVATIEGRKVFIRKKCKTTDDRL